MAELQQASGREAVRTDTAIGTAVNVEVTDFVLDRFQKSLNKFAARQKFFPDSALHSLKTPQQIYDKTQRLSAVLVGPGRIDVLAPYIQKRDTRNAAEPSVIQLQAREFGMERARLGVIAGLRGSGELSEWEALRLTGDQDPDAALGKHEERFQRWLDGIDWVAARASDGSGKNDKSGASGTGGREFAGGSLLAAAAIVRQYEDASPVTRRVMRVVGPATAASLLLTACGAPMEAPIAVPTAVESHPSAIALTTGDKALESWQTINFSGTQLTKEGNPVWVKDPSGETLLTLSPIVDGKLDLNTQYAFGTQQFRAADTGQLVEVPIMLPRVGNNPPEVNGLLLDLTNSKGDTSVFYINRLSGNELVNQADQMSIEKTPDGYIFSIIHPDGSVTYLASSDQQIQSVPTAAPEVFNAAFHVGGDVPLLATPGVDPKPTSEPIIMEPENTKPTVEVKPGVNVPVEAETTSLTFTNAYISNTYENKEITDDKYKTESGDVLLVVMEGTYKGDPRPFMDADARVQNLITEKGLLYVMGQSGVHFGGTISLYKGRVSQGKFAILVRIFKTDAEKGDLFLYDDYHHWKVDLSQIPSHPPTPTQ